MANGTKTALNLGKTADCKFISIHFTMGIGRMKQIATKVVNTAAEAENTLAQTVVVTDAKASELRQQKRLIDSPELEAIRSSDSKLRAFIESVSATAGIESTRFVLTSEVNAIWRAMEAYRTLRRPSLVAAFMAKYRAAEATDFAQQRADLGGEFNRKDYRPADEVEAGFTFTYTIRNVGELTLTGLPSEIVQMEIEKEQVQRAEAVAEFVGILRMSALELVDSLYNQVKPNIDGKKRRFSDSCISNLLNFVANFDKQNVGGDLGMEPVIAQLKAALAGVNPDKVKESDNLKAELTEKLESVKKTLHVLVQATGRKIR